MRNKQAKFLKYFVLDAVYGMVPKSERRKILKDPKFKQLYRARKRNYLKAKREGKKVV
jgi:hypothetical protein